jgi:glycosyltransferase involved in cell wall biosynthesis
MKMKKLYFIDVDFTKDIGGAGKATRDIIIGLSKFVEVFFILKYSEVKKIKKEGREEDFIKLMNYLKSEGIHTSQSIEDYIINKKDLGLKTYIDLIINDVEEGSLVFDLNYFPYLDAPEILSIGREFLYYGEIYSLKKLKRCKAIVLLQTLNDRKVNSHFALAFYLLVNFRFFSPYFILKSFYRNLRDPNIIKRLVKFSEIIFVYSNGAIESMKIKQKLPNLHVLRIGNTIGDIHVTPKKQKYAIFFARLIPEKGVFDIVHILINLVDTVDMKLIITGKFSNSRVKNKFFEMLKKYNLLKNIEYLGYLPTEELFEKISNAKVFINPTHYDSFSYAILESISVGTCVVTYDLPTLSSIYQNLKCVKLVKEFDTKAMAIESLKFFKMEDSEYKMIFDEPRVKAFIDIHKNQMKSINEIKSYIQEMIGSNN